MCDLLPCFLFDLNLEQIFWLISTIWLREVCGPTVSGVEASYGVAIY
jgi:hypothetical protein